jgi:protocatechuate 3,4-dioxygenase beta subunit
MFHFYGSSFRLRSFTQKIIFMERKKFLKNSLGMLSVATIIDACKKSDINSGTGGTTTASITSLNCSSAVVAAGTVGLSYLGTATIPYTGGNGIAYAAGTAIAASGVTGLTATLQAGTLASGSGNLIYLITGTPAATGNAVFAFSFGGQSCSMLLVINAAGSTAASITGLNCAGVSVSAATAGTAFSGNASVPYTGGNGAAYGAGTSIASTGVTGLTAILQSGTLASGTGNLVYLITGTASAAGTAVFAINFGGQSCSISQTVNTASATCVIAPNETEGPYPYPGGEINNPLNISNIKGDRTGVAFALTIKLVNTNASCAALPGYRVDIWHCDRRGYYSGYANQPGVDGTLSYVGSTWLRGYQIADASGSVTFATIFPGWYTSRACHIHVEIFNGTTMVKTTQLAFPQATGDAVAVLTSPQYNGTVNPTTNATDSVFSDSINQNQLMTLSGSIAAGYTATHIIGIAV